MAVIRGSVHKATGLCHNVISETRTSLLARCHRDSGDEPGKRAVEGIEPGIFQMHSDCQSKITPPHVRQFSFTLDK